MVVTNSKKLTQKVRTFKNLGRSKHNRFVHSEIGYSLNLSNLQAALGLSQLQEIEAAIQYKHQMAKIYRTELAGVPGLILPADYPTGRQVYWMYPVRIEAKKFGCSRQELTDQLWTDYGIQTRTFFNAPKVAFKPLKLFQHQKFPVAEEIGRTGFYLPSGTGQSLADFKFVAEAIKKIHTQINSH
jgi:perosamine synthetase